jgi:hypothetical protein
MRLIAMRQRRVAVLVIALLSLVEGLLWTYRNGLPAALSKATRVAGVQAVGAAADDAVFEDALKGKLGEGWSWLRENPKNWRHSDNGLEIRVEPGLAATVQNALVRKAPDRTEGKVAIEVTVDFTSAPTRQYEQAGITWYQGDKPVFKLVHEFIDKKLYIIPGKKPADTHVVQLRLVVSKDAYIAQFRLDAKGDFQTSASGKLAPARDDKVSIQCYNGPADAEHWMRFSDFRIVKVPE